MLAIALESGTVFPTPVGMNRQDYKYGLAYTRVPHTRGDEPECVLEKYLSESCSPHPWG